MIFAVSRRRWIVVASIVAALLFLIQHSMNSHTVKYACNGRYFSDLAGSKYIKNEAIFGISIERWNTIFEKGGFVHTIMMRDITEGQVLNRGIYSILPEDPNQYLIDSGFDRITLRVLANRSNDKGAVRIVVSELTQTLHFEEQSSEGLVVRKFDGRCHKLD